MSSIISHLTFTSHRLLEITHPCCNLGRCGHSATVVFRWAHWSGKGLVLALLLFVFVPITQCFVGGNGGGFALIKRSLGRANSGSDVQACEVFSTQATDVILQEPEQWVNSVFGEMKPSNAFINRNAPAAVDADRLCIMEDPVRTMSNPLLGTDLSETVQNVMESMNQRACSRKNVLVTMRGVGGGKTRLLEEVRRELMKNPDVLPVAITFGHHTNMSEVEFPVEDGYWSAALSIVARMASVYYGVPLAEIVATMHGALPSLNSKHRNTNNFYAPYIRLMRDQLCQVEKPATKFVLLLDDNLKLVNVLKTIYSKMRNPFAQLRFAVLTNTQNAALVLSYEEVRMPGINMTSRKATALPVCERLDPDEIVAKWWGICDEKLQPLFRRIAAMLCDLPRALEIAHTYIQAHDTELAKPQFGEQMVTAVAASMLEKYPDSRNIPSATLLFAAVFNTIHDLDEETSQAIQSSIFTNIFSQSTLLTAQLRRSTPCRVFPRVNLFLLSLCTGSDSFASTFLSLLKQIIISSVKAVKRGNKKAAARELLQEHTALWLSARVGVAMHSNATISLRDLLNIGYNRAFMATIAQITLSPDMLSTWTQDATVPSLQHRSNGDPDESRLFLQEMEHITVTLECPIMLRRAAKLDDFDVVMKVFDADAPGQCRYVFIHNQSKHRTDCMPLKEYEHISVERFPEQGKHAKGLSAVMASTGAPTIFIYLTTHAVKQAVHQPPEWPHMQWVYCGRDETAKFMGPLWGLHNTLRECPLSADFRVKVW